MRSWVYLEARHGNPEQFKTGVKPRCKKSLTAEWQRIRNPITDPRIPAGGLHPSDRSGVAQETNIWHACEGVLVWDIKAGRPTPAVGSAILWAVIPD